ncbi:MAG: glycosyltransferase family 4 protein [Serratia sp. (in: enterobacteria)]|uniref:glycosyltransferase family 4 protein n=1 Tax=Serratia sp. (in: enterobacteria) TaxID=616 RepID=UPI003F3FB8A6
MVEKEKNKKDSIIILHDVDGRIYFQGVELLKEEGVIGNIVYRETSVFRRLLAAAVKRTLNKETLIRAWNNLWFRLKMPFMHDNVIILGIAPYNFRFFMYSMLAINNQVIYHTSWPYWWTENVPSKYGPLTKFFMRFFNYLINKLDFNFVCVTKPVADSLAVNLDCKYSINVIPHAVDLKLFNNFFTQKICFEKCVTKVLYVGRMVKEKGVYEIAQLAHKLKDSHHFTFVGSGVELQELTRNLQGLDNVSILGQIGDKSALANIFKTNDVLLLPSKRIDGWEELFGLVLIEAMACGLIVVATDHIGPRGIINDGEDGVIISEVGMVDKMEGLLININEDYVSWFDMRERARASVEKYSIQSVSKQWSKVINNGKDSI